MVGLLVKRLHSMLRFHCLDYVAQVSSREALVNRRVLSSRGSTCVLQLPGVCLFPVGS